MPRALLAVWRENFPSLLKDVPLTDCDKVRVAINRIMNHKAADAAGFSVELFKHQLLCRIYSDESMPDDCNGSVFSSYHGIYLLNTVYKVLASVLRERLKTAVKKQIGLYQCGV